MFCFSVLDTKIQNKAELVTSDDAMRTPMRKRRSKNDILKGFYLQLIGKVQEAHVGLESQTSHKKLYVNSQLFH